MEIENGWQNNLDNDMGMWNTAKMWRWNVLDKVLWMWKCFRCRIYMIGFNVRHDTAITFLFCIEQGSKEYQRCIFPSKFEASSRKWLLHTFDFSDAWLPNPYLVDLLAASFLIILFMQYRNGREMIGIIKVISFPSSSITFYSSQKICFKHMGLFWVFGLPRVHT